MKNKIILKNGKEIVGVNNIVISELGQQIYINSSLQIEDNIAGALAVYSNDGAACLIGTGNNLTWNYETSTLQAINITAKNASIESINSNIIKTERFESLSIRNSDYFETKKAAIEKWLGFNSLTVPDAHPFKISVSVNPKNKNEMLLFKSNDYNGNSKSSILMAFDNDRVYLNSITNITNKTITASLGQEGDIKGDISVDADFVYYCTQDFDGVSNIWKRCNLETW